jgi:hypothetical protein
LVFHHCTSEGNHIKLSTTKAKESDNPTMKRSISYLDKVNLPLVPENP